jgi:hypothetical protein
MFEDLDLLYLQAPVGKGQENNPDDVEALDGTLRKINAYAPPAEYADNAQRYTTEPMIGALERYQEQKGLKIDGVAKPGGPTERSINNDLLGKPRGAGLLYDPPSALTGTVGNGSRIDARTSPASNAASARSTISPKTRSTSRTASSTKTRRTRSRNFSARRASSKMAGSRPAARPSVR